MMLGLQVFERYAIPNYNPACFLPRVWHSKDLQVCLQLRLTRLVQCQIISGLHEVLSQHYPNAFADDAASNEGRSWSRRGGRCQPNVRHPLLSLTFNSLLHSKPDWARADPAGTCFPLYAVPKFSSVAGSPKAMQSLRPSCYVHQRSQLERCFTVQNKWKSA